jgi:hypothetical protein
VVTTSDQAEADANAYATLTTAYPSTVGMFGTSLSHAVSAATSCPADDENDVLPLELLAHVFLFLDQRALLLSVSAVCRRWRLACKLVRGVRIDFSFLPPTAALHRALNPDLSEQYSEDYENP